MKYSRTGHVWTTEEDLTLKFNVEKGFSMKAICQSHQRTKGSIIHRMKRNHINFHTVSSFEPPTMDEENEEKQENTRLICVLDTETTGKDVPFAAITDSQKWSVVRLVQFAYELYTVEGELVEKKCVLIKPDGYTIPESSTLIHGIIQERAMNEGITMIEVCSMLEKVLPKVNTIVAHNLEFDTNVIQSELYRYHQFFLLDQWKQKENECTMLMGKRYLGKWTKLSVLAEHCGIQVPTGLHQADVDTHLCATIYFYLLKKHMSNKKNVFQVSMEDRNVFKLLGGRWDAGQKNWYMDEAEPYYRYTKKWFQ